MPPGGTSEGQPERYDPYYEPPTDPGPPQPPGPPLMSVAARAAAFAVALALAGCGAGAHHITSVTKGGTSTPTTPKAVPTAGAARCTSENTTAAVHVTFYSNGVHLSAGQLCHTWDQLGAGAGEHWRTVGEAGELKLVCSLAKAEAMVEVREGSSKEGNTICARFIAGGWSEVSEYEREQWHQAVGG
jgi:hypothetical protein